MGSDSFGAQTGAAQRPSLSSFPAKDWGRAVSWEAEGPHWEGAQSSEGKTGYSEPDLGHVCFWHLHTHRDVWGGSGALAPSLSFLGMTDS